MNEQAVDFSQFFASWELFRDPSLTGALAGALLGLLGVYVVLRRMVFLSAALSQAAGLGVASAWYAQLYWGLPAWIASPTLGATVMTLLAAAAMLAGRSHLATRRDGVLGQVYLLGAAGTLALGTRIVQEVQDIESILFGSAVAVLPEDFHHVAWLACGLGLLHLWAHRGFALVVVDADAAQVRRLPVRLLEVTLVLSLAVSVSVCTRVLGALPVFAFTVLPAMAALRLSPNVSIALLTATVVGAASGFGGYLIAFRFRLPVGASQALVAAGFSLLATLVSLLRTRLPLHREEHSHGPGCGHLAIQHADHVDYLHDGHLHAPGQEHGQDHALAVTASNRAECTPDHACTSHDPNHRHGPDCGHESVPHGDHVDYLVGDHLHHPHQGHCDDHGPVVTP
jgi:zinc transport system permease protein